MTFIKLTFLCFTIWILTAMQNAVLGGVVLSYFSNESNPWPGVLLLVFVFTLIFSLPGIFIFWIVLLTNRNEVLLFRTLLRAGLVIACLSSLLIFIVPDDDIKAHPFLLSLCVVIASIASIMIHHPIIQSICRNKSGYHV